MLSLCSILFIRNFTTLGKKENLELVSCINISFQIDDLGLNEQYRDLFIP